MSSATPKESESMSTAAGTFNTGHPEVLVTTMNDVPGASPGALFSCLGAHPTSGYEILEVYGTIFGLTVRSRNVFRNIGAGFKAMVGGELTALSKNIETARVAAVDRLVGHAMEKHANAGECSASTACWRGLQREPAVIAMRFDTSTGGAGGDQVAVTAYGTACKIRKIESAAASK